MITRITKAGRMFSLILVVAMLLACLLPTQNVLAADYCSKLKLDSHEIKVNGTTTYDSIVKIQEAQFFPEAQDVHVTTTIKTKKTTSGDKNKVKFSVTWEFKDDPQIVNAQNYDDYYWTFLQPCVAYTVFDYNTGKSIEDIKGSKVKVKGSDYKYDLYDKQYWTTIVDPAELGYDEEDLWYRNYKTIKVDFTVTYPKTYKDACVGICLYNATGYEETDIGCVSYDPGAKQYKINEKYWKGKKPFGKTTYYKNGKNSSAFVRL